MPNPAWARRWLKRMAVLARRGNATALRLDRAVVLAISCGLPPADISALLDQQDFSWNQRTGDVVDRRPVEMRQVTPGVTPGVAPGRA